MTHALRIPASDGVTLGARVYEPAPCGPRAHIVIHGATAVPQRYYEKFAVYLAEQGYRVLTYDYRGIGSSRSGPLRGDPATMRQWGELDAAAAFAYLRSTAKGGPIVSFGHSFGGQTIGLCDAWRAADAAVLVASQLGYWGHWPSPTRFRHAAMWYAFVPAAATMFGHLPGWLGLGTDLPAGVARQWASWCRDPEYLIGSLPEARARFSRFRAPTLLFSFSDDDYAPPAAVDALAHLLPAKTVHRVALTPEEVGSPVGHFGFFRPRAKDTLWQAALDWIVCALKGRTGAVIEPPPASEGAPADSL